MFVLLNTESGKIALNLDHVISIEPGGDGGSYISTPRETILTTVTFDEVMSALIRADMLLFNH